MRRGGRGATGYRGSECSARREAWGAELSRLFQVCVGMCPRRAAARPGGKLAGPMDRGALHVLLVEDDAKLARLTRDYLEQHGLTVTRVSDGTAAIREGVRPDFDVVVLDLMLPGRDGFEVCRELR